MKKNNAFTLIELMAVILIIATIALISLPAVTKSIKNAREQAYNNQIEAIKKSAKDYVTENIKSFSKDGTYTINLSALKTSGLIDAQVKSPKTNRLLDDSMSIQITKVGSKYSFIVGMCGDNDDEDCLKDINTNQNIDYDDTPIIVLNGSAIEYVEVNASCNDNCQYNTANASLAGNSSHVITPTYAPSNVNISSTGKYTATYTYTDSNGKDAIPVVKTIIVRDTTKPTISFPASTTIYVDVINNGWNFVGSGLDEDDYIYNDVSIYDNSFTTVDAEDAADFKNNTTYGKLSMYGNLSKVPGTYYITYRFEDKSGNVINKVRKINVVAAGLWYTLTINKGIRVNSISVTGCASNGNYTYACEYGATVTLSATASTGYTLGTWTGGTVTNNNFTMPGNDTTLSIDATVTNYTITYNNNGGSGCTSGVVNVETGYANLCIPTKADYTFAGWYKDSELTNKVTTSTTITTSDHTLYADWNLNKLFAYTGSAQTFVVPKDGYYKIELWGAQGGNGSYSSTTYYGGKGAYTSGKISLTKNENIYLYVGGSGSSISGASKTVSGGYNGGGSGYTSSTAGSGGSGGGATDVRYGGTSINDRIMVAAGGGGSYKISSTSNYYGQGGYGGSLIGGTSEGKSSSASESATGGTQTSVNFGSGGSAGSAGSPRPGGGGGYYGGNTAVYTAGGGSSYISGHTGCVAITSSTDTTPKSGCANGTTNNDCSIHYSGKVFTDTQMIAGNASMPSIDGSTETGHAGNGYAKITYIENN